MNKQVQQINNTQLHSPPVEYVRAKRLKAKLFQTGGKVNKDDFKKSLSNFNTKVESKQDATSRVQPKVVTPQTQSSYDRDQGTIKAYDKSPREKIMSQAQKMMEGGNGLVAGLISQPVLSATRLLRPDNYFRGIQSDSDFGDAITQLGTDALTVLPAVKGVTNYIGKSAKAAEPIVRGGNTYLSLGSDEINAVKAKNKLQKAMEAKVLPIGKKKMLPSLEFKIADRDLAEGFQVTATEPGTDNVFASLKLKPSGARLSDKVFNVNGVEKNYEQFERYAPRLSPYPEELSDLKQHGITYETRSRNTMTPDMIEVDKSLQGRRMQDALYQEGIKESQRRGYEGVRSGDNLVSPAKTVKAHERFDREVLIPNKETKGVIHDVAILKGHKNPNVTTDWLKDYNKNRDLGREKLSVIDVLDKLKGKPSKMQQNIPGFQDGGKLRNKRLTLLSDNTKVNNNIPLNNSAKAIDLSKQQTGINNLAIQKDKYFNPEVKNYSSGNLPIDFLYRNQWLINTPVVGDGIKEMARHIASNSSGQSVVDMSDDYGKYEGINLGDDYVQETPYKGPNLVDQYFGKVQLPKSKYKPISDYLTFLPSVSIKGEFDKYNKDYDMSEIINDISEGKKITDYRKPIFKSYESGQKAPLLNKLGSDLGGHKSGIGWDKERNLPYVSISDAWDFSPKDYAKNYIRDENSIEYQKAYIQSSLMHKAGKPFKVYDRFYFDPKTNKYIADPDKRIINKKANP